MRFPIWKTKVYITSLSREKIFINYLKLYSVSVFQNFENLILNNFSIKGKNCWPLTQGFHLSNPLIMTTDTNLSIIF